MWHIYGFHCAGLSDFSVRGAAPWQFSRQIYTVFILQASKTSQYVVPRGGIFLNKWRSSFVGNSDSKMNVQSGCALNTRYIAIKFQMKFVSFICTYPSISNMAAI
jgi:hypothetical protein